MLRDLKVYLTGQTLVLPTFWYIIAELAGVPLLRKPLERIYTLWKKAVRQS